MQSALKQEWTWHVQGAKNRTMRLGAWSRRRGLRLTCGRSHRAWSARTRSLDFILSATGGHLEGEGWLGM